MREPLALTWFEHRRTRGLCAGLGIELVAMDVGFRGAPRYLLLGLRTIVLLLRRSPRVLLVSNPSLGLSALAVVLRRFFGYRLVVDAHNEAVMPFMHKQRWLQNLSRWIVRKADLTIVSNRQLAAVVEEQGGRPFTLPDPLPVPPTLSPRKLDGEFNVVLVSTFAPDEPVGAVFEAVRDSNISLYVTGNSSKLDPAAARNISPNIHLTGFLADEEYWKLLRSADALIDLTLMDNCLVCGAYEGLALGKPMLLSKNPASVELFGDCALYTDNTSADILRLLRRLRTDYAPLQRAGVNKHAELTAAWAVRSLALCDILRQWQTGTRSESAL